MTEFDLKKIKLKIMLFEVYGIISVGESIDLNRMRKLEKINNILDSRLSSYLEKTAMESHMVLDMLMYMKLMTIYHCGFLNYDEEFKVFIEEVLIKGTKDD